MRSKTIFLVVDVQERLAPAMHPDLLAPMLKNLDRVGQAAEILRVPALISEQYPAGLGPTLETVRRSFPAARAMAKMCFDAMKDLDFSSALRASGRRTVVVSGMETHICVYQTVRSLVRDYEVHVLRDAVASRSLDNYEVGLDLIRSVGGVVSSTETVLFDLLERAGTDEFRAVSKLVR